MATVTIVDDNDKRYQYIVDNSLPPIGKGGMGTVYRGIQLDRSDPNHKRDVAIKFLHEGLDSNVIERERRTAKISIKSENVVEMMGFITMTVNTSNGIRTRHFVVSELLNGVSLLNLLKGVTTDVTGKDFDFARLMLQRFRIDRTQFVIDIACKVLNGLDAIHKAGYIHRDIDPSNVMLTSKGEVKIIDFGIAKKVDPTAKSEPTLTNAGSGMGKAVYSSPEVLSGQLEAQNAMSDLYSVGIMIYAIAVGRLPYSGTMTAIMIKKATNPVPVADIEHPALRNVVRAVTDNNQAKRYKTAQQFINELNKINLSSNRLPVWAWILIGVGILSLLGTIIALITII
ncbi:MAG: serine/threonine protein kinase [Bacteroides sp.]|nr:serine/threonine protein kinase [Bacteroides sp.]